MFICLKCTIYVAVLGRNRPGCIFQSHYRIRSAVMQYFRYSWGSYSLCKLINTWYIYTARMSPTLNGSSALQHFGCSNAIEICNRIPGTATCLYMCTNVYSKLQNVYSSMFWSVLYTFIHVLKCTIHVYVHTKLSRTGLTGWKHCWYDCVWKDKVVFNKDETSKFGWCKLLTICHK